MIIKDLQIDGFGVWSDLELAHLDGGLTLLYGENETGKTTLLEFVRSVLYGYDDERRQKYLPPVRGGLGGGTLGVSTHAGQFRIRRRAEGDGHQGRLDLTSYNGTAQDLRQMKKILADLDEATFKNVFALGLSEIQELGTLSGGGAAEFLYDLAVGSGGVSLTEVQRELDGARTRLFSGERSAHVSKLLDERNKLLADIEQLRALGRNYTLLADERQRLADDVERCELESTELHASADIFEAAVHVYERWHTRNDVAEKLAGLGELAPIPDEAWTKLNAWRERYKEIRPTLDKLKAERGTFRKQMRELPLNKILWRQGPRIEVLAAQLTWIDQLETEIRKLEAEIKPAAPAPARRETLSGELVKLGLTPSSAEKLSDKRLLRNLFNVHRERRDADKRLEQAAEAEARVRDRYEPTATVVETTKPAAPARRETAALETQGQLVANLRKRVQVDQKIEQLSGHREESQRRIRDLLTADKAPADLILNLNTGFVVGALLFFTGLLATRENLLLVPNMVLWIVGGFMAAMCGFSKIMRDLAQNEQLESLRNQARSIETELRDLESERDELDAKIPPGAGPILTRLQYAERDLAELEERVGDAQAQHLASNRRETVVVRDESREEYESIRVEFRTAQELAEKANRRWQHDLERAGFPANITWDQLRSAAKSRSKTDAEKRRVEKRNKYVERRRGELALIADRVTQAFTEAQLEPQGDRVSDQLRYLYAEWRNNEDLIERRKELRGELRGVDRRLNAARKELTTLAKRRKQLLKSLGTSTEKMLRRRRDRLKLQAELREQHAVLSREITLGLGSRGTEEELRARMENFELPQLEQRWNELTERLTAVEARLKELYEEQGRLQAKLEAAAADASLPRKLYDLKRIESAVGDALTRWQTLTVAARLVEQVRKKYEAERQPETLREASRYFERLTEGKYKRVWTPLEAGVLFVDTAGGERLSVDVLSRGTREQLFLALRLALVDLYARRGKVMPLVLDDVLVNFDTRRTRIAAELLCDFATEQRQLLLFTCHEHIVRLFRTLRAEVRLLPGQHVSDEDTPVRTVEKIVEKVVEKVVKVKEPVYLPAPVVEMPAMPWLNGAGVFHELPKPKPVPPPKMELPPPPPPVVIVKEPEYEDVVEEVIVEAPPETIVRTKRVGYPVVPLWSPATPFAEANWQESIEDDPRDASQLKTLGNLPTTSLGNGGNGNGNHGGRPTRNGGVKNRVPRPTPPRPQWAEDEFGDDELPETE